MWLFTTDGFYSVVTAEEFGHELQIRARARRDLDRLRATHLPSLSESMHLPGRDYPWRAFTTHDAFAEGAARLARSIDYSNFKDAVHERRGHDRASVYAKVWSACLAIEKKSGPRSRPVHRQSLEGKLWRDRTDEYRQRDLHAEGQWPSGSKRRYGGVIFDEQARVLLREPLNHFDGYHWTFPKGAPEPGEHPTGTSLREVFEETGHRPVIIGHVPGSFRGGTTGSTNYFYLMQTRAESTSDALAVRLNRETSDLNWATEDEASSLIKQSTNRGGRDRDLEILEAGFLAYRHLSRPT